MPLSAAGLLNKLIGGTGINSSPLEAAHQIFFFSSFNVRFERLLHSLKFHLQSSCGNNCAGKPTQNTDINTNRLEKSTGDSLNTKQLLDTLQNILNYVDEQPLFFGAFTLFTFSGLLPTTIEQPQVCR